MRWFSYPSDESVALLLHLLLFASLFPPSCFLGSCSGSPVSSQREVSSDAFDLFLSNVVLSRRESLDSRERLFTLAFPWVLPRWPLSWRNSCIIMDGFFFSWDVAITQKWALRSPPGWPSRGQFGGAGQRYTDLRVPTVTQFSFWCLGASPSLPRDFSPNLLGSRDPKCLSHFLRCSKT